MSLIYDNLFLGNVQTSRDDKFFKKHNIKHVLIAAKSLKRSFPSSIDYFQLPISDNPTTLIIKYWAESAEFIAKCPGNVLVHCQGGKSRSASTVMAFVMFKENISSDESVQKVRKLHKFAYPNPGFLRQLEYWQEVLTEYRNQVPFKEKEDFSKLSQLLSNKLHDITEKIISPSQSLLSESSAKLGTAFVCAKPKKAMQKHNSVKDSHDDPKQEKHNKYVLNKKTFLDEKVVNDDDKDGDDDVDDYDGDGNDDESISNVQNSKNKQINDEEEKKQDYYN